MASPMETLRSLNSARDIVLRDHTLYPQVVPGILQVIAPAAQLELRRWGADFLAETFASQVVTAEEKQLMSPIVLDTIRGYLNRKELLGEEEDTSVVKSAVQCASSIYPHVFRHTVSSPQDSETWGAIVAIKSGILRRMDNASPGVRICCIKFVSCVVQTQTPGLIADPRRPEHNEISLALVPRDHPVIQPANLEAEASGLLDRLLGVLQDNLTDPLIVTATLNSLATLVQRRPSISSKILTAVLNFNPLRLANKPMSSQDRIAVRSMTRTMMSFLVSCLKRNPNNAFSGRMQQLVERLRHGLIEAFSENHLLKRSAPDEPVDGLDDAKRQRLDADASNGLTLLQQNPHNRTALPTGPITLSQLFTLTDHEQTANFHCERLPAQVVTQLIPVIMQATPQAKIDEAINIIRARWLNLGRQQVALVPNSNKAEAGEDDDDDYDPSLMVDEKSDQPVAEPDSVATNGVVNGISASTFRLSTPPAMTDQDRQTYSKTALTRVFDTLSELEKEERSRNKQPRNDYGLNRLAAMSALGNDRDGWLLLITRLATRTAFDLNNRNGTMKREGAEQSLLKKGTIFDLSSGIREAILNYVMENFRARIGVAITWLNEEWYSDRLLQKQKQDEGEDIDEDDLPNYWHWALRSLDAMLPYFDVKDGRILIRFLSEVPAVNRDLLERVKKVAEDPERVQISTNALLYLVMFRPPARQLALDCAEQMWRENRDAKTSASKILAKWRPAVLEQPAAVEPDVKM